MDILTQLEARVGQGEAPAKLDVTTNQGSSQTYARGARYPYPAPAQYIND
jgi:hypothetical protein